MSNLKKILALVLALVMTFSVMSVASAAGSTDEIKAEYAESVEILNYLGVFRGYEDGTFKPQNSITRAEVAAIIYRIDTGDVSDEQVKIYADYNRFDDVKSTAWYAGYVNYCANAEYIKGYDENTFGPNDKVTGYQALAMILRVVGYDKNNEFSGSAWQIEVAKYANKLGITANVNANTLGVAATRELIAELLWRTVYEVPTVTYTLLQGYNQYQDTFHTSTSKLNPTINEEKFFVFHECDTDEWGRPGVSYYAYGSYNYYITGFRHTPVYVGYTAMTECDVALKMGLSKDTNITVWENGEVNKYTRLINRNYDKKTNPDHIVGEQGTLIELYVGANYDGTASIARIVMIDTYLAQVTAKNAEKVDKAGHKYQNASNDINVFTHDGNKAFNVTYGTYNKGSFVLTYINEYYDANGIARERVFVDYLRDAAVVEGKQTVVKFNSGKHYIEKVEYNDNVNYVLDQAEFDRSNSFYWFFDEQNNVMGSVLSPEAVRYAVVTDAQWINAVGTNGYAQATLYFVGEETSSEKIFSVNGVQAHYVDTLNVDFNAGQFATTYQYNNKTALHLYEVTEDAYGRGLVLNEVEIELANAGDDAAWFKKGVSAIKTGDAASDNYATYTNTGYYVDNNTVYVYWDDTDNNNIPELNTVVGYDNLPREIKGQYVDVVLNYNAFAGIVYIANEAYIGSGVTDKFVYVTDKAMTYALKNYFAVSGVIGADGSTDALYFLPEWYGNDIETQATLDSMVELYKDSLLKVTIDNASGVCVAVTPVLTGSEVLSNNISSKQDVAMYVPNGAYFFVNAGVVKVGTLALNVNNSTVIINDDGTGLTINDLLEIVGKDLYVVYKGTTAKAIFVVGELNNLYRTFIGAFSDLTAANFAVETSTNVYEIGSDVDAFVAEVVAESAVNDVFGMAGQSVEVYECTATLNAANNKLTVEVVLSYTYEFEGEEVTAFKPVTLVFKAK